MVSHVYIHFPFCLNKCPYCSFYSETFEIDKKDKYLTSLHKEIDFYLNKYDIVPETIYFGGGTPSLLKPEEVFVILNRFGSVGETLATARDETGRCKPYPYDVSRDFKSKNHQEITLETNPATVNIVDLKIFKEAGINRISLGVQSMNDSDLRTLGRRHKIEDVNILFNQGMTAIFDNISIDIMYGLPAMGNPDNTKPIGDLHYDMSHFNKILSLCNHVSIYCLTLEENVPLYKFHQQLPDDDTLADMYFSIRDYLLERGYEQYELSNFAKDGLISIHNNSYWSAKNYIGFGAGASGFVDNIRYTNNKLDKYLQNDFIGETINLSTDDLEKEYIITGLRKTEGISLVDFEKRFNLSFLEKYAKKINKLLDLNLIEVYINDSKYIKITPQSYFIINEVLCEFL